MHELRPLNLLFQSVRYFFGSTLQQSRHKIGNCMHGNSFWPSPAHCMLLLLNYIALNFQLNNTCVSSRIRTYVCICSRFTSTKFTIVLGWRLFAFNDDACFYMYYSKHEVNRHHAYSYILFNQMITGFISCRLLWIRFFDTFQWLSHASEWIISVLPNATLSCRGHL